MLCGWGKGKLKSPGIPMGKGRVQHLHSFHRHPTGFTLLETLVAMAVGVVVLGAMYLTFKSQRESYLVQNQISATQQNARAALYVITRDIQMAGYYTSFDSSSYSMDWDELDGDEESIRPLIYGRNNIMGQDDGVKDNTDLIVIVKSSGKGRQLTSGEAAVGNVVAGSLRDVDNLRSGKCALLVKRDLSVAEFFRVQDDSGDMILPFMLREAYEEGDWIYRADVIIYYVDDNPDHPGLRRKNLGSNQGAQVVAEDIDDLQFRYLLRTGNWIDAEDTDFREKDIRAVEIFLVARTSSKNRGYRDSRTYTIGDRSYVPDDAYRRRILHSIVKTRNMGL
ncbi:MAG: PilW family protein [Deltaproteobacteria bacterium]|nr:PilW family protein [Deltaproteobacteria bacterium]